MSMIVTPEVLRQLVGTDDTPGLLDEYRISAIPPMGDGKPTVLWHCPRDHGDAGKGHVGLIARDMNGDQSGLTLGELVEAALEHEEEAHRP